ncbi:IclR family transcriptional regulator [Falsiroseomonas stagni]|uniref:Transcriptional regulator, IclR family n=1 Tax=Falsiroseomonas stagni DSM 19981 TaxID=1123062 RepID=A0A1I4C908_9PROT|nr:IclR family transcriptional regulator [Falsiroseomonas stagni]SFK77602.1 transcriptional regulator, IclR family [Falsiroseomonas stagni DSM 19981]
MSDDTEGTAAVRSVLMAVRVLEAMALAGGPMRVSDLARDLAEPKGRVHRHLVTLRQAGLVAQEETTERYHLTWRMYQIGQAAGEQFDLKRVAEPAMHRLRDAVGQSVLLAVPTGGDPLVVHALEAPNKVSITVQPGNRPAAHCSAQGRIMLAFAAAELRDRLLSGPLEKLTPDSITDPAVLRDRIALVRDRLWETAPGEALTGINVLAAPLFAAGEVLVGSLGIVGSVQFVQDPPPASMLEALHEAASAVSARLGSNRYLASGGTKSRQ